MVMLQVYLACSTLSVTAATLDNSPTDLEGTKAADYSLMNKQMSQEAQHPRAELANE